MRTNNSSISETRNLITKCSDILSEALQEIEGRKLEAKKIPQLAKNVDEYKHKLAIYTEEIKSNGNNINLYIKRGQVYNGMKEYQMAINDFNHALQMVEEQLNIPDNLDSDSIQTKLLKLKKQLRHNYEFEIYSGRGNSFAGMEDYEKALKEYSLSLSKKPFSTTDGTLLDAVFISRAFIYYKMNLFELALNDLDEAIKIASLKFIPLFNKGLLLYLMEQYEKAIPFFSDVINLNENYYYAHFIRGLSYQAIGELDLAYTDYNRYLYLCIIHKRKEFFMDLLVKFNAYPYTIKTILNEINVDNLTLLSGLYSEIVFTIEDFLLLIEYIELSLSDKRAVLSIKAILYYYLKGSVDSFIIFDNELDNDQFNLSARELYYYSKVAYEVNTDAIPIWENAVKTINAQNDKNDIDLYYLGQIYLLNEHTEEAIQCFKASQHCIYSQLMLSQLEEDSHWFNIKPQILNKIAFLEEKVEIEKSHFDLAIFEDFFHLKECSEALESLDNDGSSDLIKFFCQTDIWDLFIFSPATTNYLSSSILKLKAQKKLKGAYIEFDCVMALFKIFNKITDPVKLKSDLVEYKGRITKLFYIIENAIKDGADPENQIGMAIEDWEYPHYLAYLDLIKYYLLTEKINSEQVFNLLIYLTYRLKTIDNKLPNANDLLNLSAACIISLGISQVFVCLIQCVCRIIIPSFQEEYCDHDDALSGYRKFKENIWRIMVDKKGKDIVDMLKLMLSQKSILNSDLIKAQ